MCNLTPKIPTPAAPLIAANDNSEAIRQGNIEARLRRARSGAAANVLTSAVGIPSTPQLGRMAS